MLHSGNSFVLPAMHSPAGNLVRSPVRRDPAQKTCSACARHRNHAHMGVAAADLHPSQVNNGMQDKKNRSLFGESLLTA